MLTLNAFFLCSETHGSNINEEEESSTGPEGLVCIIQRKAVLAAHSSRNYIIYCKSGSICRITAMSLSLHPYYISMSTLLNVHIGSIQMLVQTNSLTLAYIQYLL